MWLQYLLYCIPVTRYFAETRACPLQRVRRVLVGGCSSERHVYESAFVANVPAWEKIGSGLRPRIGKKSLKNGFSPHPENRGKIAQKQENGSKTHFRAIFRQFFLFLGDFSYFRGEAKIHFSAIFFLFWAGGPNRFSPKRACLQRFHQTE